MMRREQASRGRLVVGRVQASKDGYKGHEKEALPVSK